MGAYSNPETYIDTQTSQSYQRLQDTISGSFAKVAESYSARQKEIRTQLEENAKQIKANNMKAQERAFSYYKDVAKAGASDPTIDWSKTYEPLIKKTVNINLGDVNGNFESKQGAMKELAEIDASVGNMVNMIATFSGVGTVYTGAMDKGVGVEGGAASSNDPKFSSAMDVLTQRMPGIKEPYFKDADPKKIMLKISDKEGNIIQEFDADQIKKLAKGEGLFRIIPNQTAEFDKLKSTNSTIFETTPVKPGEKGDPIPTGKVTADYLVKDANGKPVVEVNEIVNTGGYKMQTFSQKVDIEAIKADTNFQATLTAQAIGLIKSNQSGAIDFYNDIMSNPKGRWKGTGFSFDPYKPFDEEGTKKFVEDYKEYYINTQIPPTQTIQKPNSNDVTLIERTPKPTKAKAGGAAGTKPTASEKNQVAFNDRIKNVIDTGEGGVSKGGYTLMKMNGRWGVYDKDGLPKPGTENITNPTTLSTFIGGTLKKKAKLKG
jgi:hypothetical protein